MRRAKQVSRENSLAGSIHSKAAEGEAPPARKRICPDSHDLRVLRCGQKWVFVVCRMATEWMLRRAVGRVQLRRVSLAELASRSGHCGCSRHASCAASRGGSRRSKLARHEEMRDADSGIYSSRAGSDVTTLIGEVRRFPAERFQQALGTCGSCLFLLVATCSQ